MKQILIFTKNSSFCDISDIFCNLLSSHETITDSSLLLQELKRTHAAGLIIDSRAADSECLNTISELIKSDSKIKIAVFLADNGDITKFSEAGVTTFLTSHNLKSALQTVFPEPDSVKKREEIAYKALSWLNNLSQSLNQGVILLDSDDKITYANRAALEILSMTSEHISRKTLDDVFTVHPYDCESKAPATFEETKHLTCEGLEISLDSSFTPTFDGDVYAGSILLFSRISGQAEARHKELELLKFQERYHSTQQSAAFKKQMLIIKDEVSGTLAGNYAFETYFKPLDIMSGDIYGTLNIKDGRYFFYIIDAMGKGLSASVTALQSSSFINHAAELSIIKNDFHLDKMLKSFTRYIRDRLMEEEALCAVFALLDTNKNTLSVSSFGMPPIMVSYDDGRLESLKTPNLPIMRFMGEMTVTEFSLNGAKKILIYSDGLSESSTQDGGLYFTKLPEAFSNASTKKHLLKIVNSEITANEDDMTFFFISTIPDDFSASLDFSVKSTPTDIAVASEFITAFMEKNNIDQSDVMTIEFALGEMLMNALEHGSFGISFDEKQKMIQEGNYDRFLDEKSSDGSSLSDKKIEIKCFLTKPAANNSRTLFISVTDEGRGFNVSDIFKYHSFDGNLCQIDSKQYNGRGIFITDNLVDGLFYNEYGNAVNILKILED